MLDKNKYYNGIHNVLKAGIELELTNEQIKELYKCKIDPIYFIRNYYKIVSQERGEIFLDLYDYQEDVILELYKNKRLILNWARQSSKTTTIAAFTLHYVIFNKNKNAFFLANKFETSKEILDRVKFAYSNLPEWLQVGVIEFNKSSVILGNKSKIYASTTSPDSIRGKSASIIYVDEMSYCENWGDFWSGIAPTIAANKEAFVCLSSTPSGYNHFFHFVVGARNKTNGFYLSEIIWTDVPGRDELWAERALKDLDGNLDEFAREYELQFLGASGCLISSKKLKAMPHKLPIITKHDDNFKIYEYPEKNERYFLICDYAEGLGQDYSTIQILKQMGKNFKQVAVYSNNILKPREFAGIKNFIGEYYNGGLIIGESNSIGQDSLNELMETYEYDSIFWDLFEKRKIGLKMTKKVKRLGNSYLKKFIENDKIEIVDFETINELSTYVSKGGSYEGDKNCHDDLVTPLVLFCFLLNQEEFIEWWVDDYELRASDLKIEIEDILPVFSNHLDEFDD